MVKQERALRTRNALLTAAGEVFSREGYRAASLTVISGNVGVSSGALHFHFPTKLDLAAAVEEAAAARLRSIVEHCERHEGPGGSVQLVIDASYQVVERLAQDPVLRAGFELGETMERAGGTGKVCDLWQRWVVSLLRHAQEAGGLRPDVVPDHLASVVVAMTAGLAALGRRDAHWPSRATLTSFWLLMLPQVTAAETPPTCVVHGHDSAAEEL
ncbi:TetR family transcriptional regulator [Streptomyces rubradiris]|uniref:TetR family transcriptional regulator n=1 Tax=Streptomyces rubradiris TaxID=285531 RepID=A0ABQ3RQX0_STRRR|nr:ScbR family autoregulator-binding transcription factor [Streptomyces rubradiris]GHH24736.1 TetR family transcriptional regulator [Streptomyces rubradiris]GHI58252.1 TetR family transcriptional regulator [Streptomyces rubradiris]